MAITCPHPVKERRPIEHAQRDLAAGTGRPHEADGTAPLAAAQRMAFLDIGRWVAALLVLYTAIDQFFLHSTGDNPVNRFVVTPLLLGTAGPAAVAVAFFFVASGFAVTPLALRLGSGRFLANRLARLYPVLIIAVGLSAAELHFGGRPLSTGPIHQITVSSMLSNLTLVNFLHKPITAYSAMAWTMLVEVLFCALLAVIVPLLRRWVWLAIAVELEFVQVLLSTGGQFGSEYHAFVANVAYLTMPIVGQVLWAGWNRRIPRWLTGVYLLAAWAQFVWADHLRIDPDRPAFPLALMLAFLFFLLGLVAEERLRGRRLWYALANRTLPIYLLQGPVLFPVLAVVHGRMPVWLALSIGLLALAVAVEVVYQFVERPGQRLRHALRPWRPPINVTGAYRDPRPAR